MSYDPRQSRNGFLVLKRVAERAKEGEWKPRDARRVARICIQCIMTESNMWMYANKNVPESLNHYHEQMGSDHYSVGLYQQQVPGWGTAAECMNIDESTDKFINKLLASGASRYESRIPREIAIQNVQISAFSDGRNYKANDTRALSFVYRYWRRACRETGYNGSSLR